VREQIERRAMVQVKAGLGLLLLVATAMGSEEDPFSHKQGEMVDIIANKVGAERRVACFCALVGGGCCSA